MNAANPQENKQNDGNLPPLENVTACSVPTHDLIQSLRWDQAERVPASPSQQGVCGPIPWAESGAEEECPVARARGITAQRREGCHLDDC